MAVEVDGAFGALVDDQRVVVSWTLREARPCLGIKLRGGRGAVIHPSAPAATDASDFRDSRTVA